MNRFRIGMILLVALVGGCTAADATPDRFGVNASFDADTDDFRSYGFNLQWNIPQPSK